MTSDENNSGLEHTDGGPMSTCATCFEEFEWEPVEAEGKVFCCPGCAGGGPCDGTRGPVPGKRPAEPTPEAATEPEAGAPPGPPTRSDALLSAVADLRVELRPALTLRYRRGMSAEEISEELSMPVSDIRALLAEGEERLRAAVGDELVDQAGRRAVAVPQAAAAVAAQESLTRFLQSSLGALQPIYTAPRATAEASDYQETIRDALHEAAAIFQAAATRLGQAPDERASLRAMIADRPAGQLRLAASGVEDPAEYLRALETLPQISSVVIDSIIGDAASYLVEVESIAALVRGILSLDDPFHPTRLSIGSEEVSIGFEAPVTAAVAAGPATGPRFELGAEAFFGARHFVNIGGRRGPTHHHSWRVEATLVSSAEDTDGVVVGFAEARELLEDLVAAYNETLLNNVAPFDEIQPTAENLARTIYRDFGARFDTPSARLTSIRVWESPTQHASYSEGAEAPSG